MSCVFGTLNTQAFVFKLFMNSLNLNVPFYERTLFLDGISEISRHGGNIGQRNLFICLSSLTYLGFLKKYLHISF